MEPHLIAILSFGYEPGCGNKNVKILIAIIDALVVKQRSPYGEGEQFKIFRTEKTHPLGF
jgi:hypothetical protein